jgi:hypothetical protein
MFLAVGKIQSVIHSTRPSGAILSMATSAFGNVVLSFVPPANTLNATGSLYSVDFNGIITTIAGNSNKGYIGDSSPATAASLSFPLGVAVEPDGSLYITDSYNSCIRWVPDPLPGSAITDLLSPLRTAAKFTTLMVPYCTLVLSTRLRCRAALPASHDIACFSDHPLLEFTYDSDGLLIEIQYFSGTVATIERDTAGNSTAIVASGGQRTTLPLDAMGIYPPSPGSGCV